ncbi:ribosomal-processing cysteine protease Prp [Pectinatus haikarae]|uniref:Ribosomal processing cysteine protease Prp n=1 Tax=Pectinatus haikarae TaxID=349096 RepID=A0ABT9Y998_9FIRM|nr:ribosomal-processing cysteine protease Prp [Pectinatus haikarae]MDQ0204409.1 uncharacterized protein YsxB (DUF464 family) [Pectinatus haikarae]
MIKITVLRNADHKTTGLLITGHAEFASHGRDIVCAAVSALAQSVILSLLEHVQAKIDFNVKSGHLNLILQDPPTELTEAVFSVALLGFREIKNGNPKNVTILNSRG